MKAVIMAAGEGTRLKPLTNTRPKVMLPVAGRPILWYVVQSVKQAGIKEAVVIVRYLKEQIIDYFKQNEPGIKLTFVEQGDNYGTGAAILTAEKHIEDTFVVVAGDTIFDPEILRQVTAGHKGEITLAVKKVSNPHLYGVVELSGSTVSTFEEKPEHPKGDFANLSIYCMEPAVFSSIRAIPKSKRGEREIVHLFLGARAVKTDAFWMDIAYPWHLLDANEYLLGKLDAKTEHVENSTINGKVVMEEGAKIINSFVEGNCYIGKGSVIGPNAIIKGNVSIGANCNIGGATTVKNSILFDNVNAKHLSYIGDSVVGSHVNLGSGTQLANFRFDEGPISIQMEKKGWVNTGRKKFGAVVGDNTKFGVLSCTMPGKSIGENCWISSGVIVNQNIAPGTQVFIKQELTQYRAKK